METSPPARSLRRSINPLVLAAPPLPFQDPAQCLQNHPSRGEVRILESPPSSNSLLIPTKLATFNPRHRIQARSEAVQRVMVRPLVGKCQMEERRRRSSLSSLVHPMALELAAPLPGQVEVVLVAQLPRQVCKFGYFPLLSFQIVSRGTPVGGSFGIYLLASLGCKVLTKTSNRWVTRPCSITRRRSCPSLRSSRCSPGLGYHPEGFIEGLCRPCPVRPRQEALHLFGEGQFEVRP